MPDFLEEFSSSINHRKELLKEKIMKGTPNPLQDLFKKYFDTMWVSVDDPVELAVNPSELSIMAVDSSVYTNLLSTGGVFYVVRSLAVCRNSEQKKLESDAFFTKGGSAAEREFVSVKMEMLEFQVAIDALKKGIGCDVVLVDGSLYGRLVHLPIESKIEEERLILLDFFRVYRELLDLCKKNHVLLVGVAKESRSTSFRDYLLSLMFKDELKRVDIDDDDSRRLKPLFMEVVDKPTLGLRKFEKLRQKCGVKLETIWLIFNELTRSRPDCQLVMNFARSLGYTQPLLLGHSPRLSRRLEESRSDPKRYVRRNFPETFREKDKEFLNKATEIVADIPKFPGIVSFYILLDKRDSPIRIDLPCWNHSLVDVGWPKPVAPDLTGLLRVLATGYCGLDCYNLWLKNVDERVRLKKRTVDSIYFPYMEKLFGEKIIRGRGYRRVKFP